MRPAPHICLVRVGPGTALKMERVQVVRLTGPTPHCPQGPGVQRGNPSSAVPSRRTAHSRGWNADPRASCAAGRAGLASSHSSVCQTERRHGLPQPTAPPPTKTLSDQSRGGGDETGDRDPSKAGAGLGQLASRPSWPSHASQALSSGLPTRWPGDLLAAVKTSANLGTGFSLRCRSMIVVCHKNMPDLHYSDQTGF